MHARRTTKPILQANKQTKKIHIKHVNMLGCGKEVSSWEMSMESGDKREFLKTCLLGESGYLIGFGGRSIWCDALSLSIKQQARCLDASPPWAHHLCLEIAPELGRLPPTDGVRGARCWASNWTCCVRAGTASTMHRMSV